LDEPSEADWDDDDHWDAYVERHRRRPLRVAVPLVLVLAAVMLGLVSVTGGSGIDDDGAPPAVVVR